MFAMQIVPAGWILIGVIGGMFAYGLGRAAGASPLMAKLYLGITGAFVGGSGFALLAGATMRTGLWSLGAAAGGSALVLLMHALARRVPR